MEANIGREAIATIELFNQIIVANLYKKFPRVVRVVFRGNFRGVAD